MALFNFTRKIINGEPIDVFNHGKMKRDFTYIDDLVESVYRLIKIAPKKWYTKHKFVELWIFDGCAMEIS